MNRRRVIATAGIAASILGVSALGATLAGAQEDAPADDPAAEEQPAPDGEAPEGCHGGRGAHLETAAEAIGISVDDLRAGLEEGQSIAEVAEANGVDPQTVIDAMVTEANAHIDEEVAAGNLTEEEAAEKRADLESRITDKVNGEFGAFGPGGPGGHHGFGPPDGEFPGEVPGEDDVTEGEGSGFAPFDGVTTS